MDLTFDLNNIQNTDGHFAVINAIEKIDASDEPDITKLRILASEMKRIFEEFSITQLEERKIWGHKYMQDRNEWKRTEMTEKEILEQIRKSEEVLHDSDATFKNMSVLLIHLKSTYNKSKAYEPFFNYALRLIHNILSNDKVVGNRDLKEKMQELEEELISKEKSLENVTQELKSTRDKLNHVTEKLADSILSEKMLQIYIRIGAENVKDTNLIKIITILNIRGGTIPAVELMGLTALKKKEIDFCVENYPEVLKRTADKIELLYDEAKLKDLQKESKKSAEMVVVGETFDEEKPKNMVSKIKQLFGGDEKKK